MQPNASATRRSHARNPSSRGISVDIEGVGLGPNCVLVRRTAAGYRCVNQDEAEAIQALVLGGENDPDWLFRQCHRIVDALADQNLALAQIYALMIPVVELGAEQLKKLRAWPLSSKPISIRTSLVMHTDVGQTKVALERAPHLPVHRREYGGNPTDPERPIPHQHSSPRITNVKTRWYGISLSS